MKETISLVLVLALGLAASTANADFVWGTPSNLGPTINGPDDLYGLGLSRDGLELYFSSNRPGGYGGYDLWVSKRESTTDKWRPPTNLGSPANSPYDECGPCLSADGLTLYFSDGHLPYDNPRPMPGILGGNGNMWELTRQTRDDPWSAAHNITPQVNSKHANFPSISVDGLSLYFQSHRSGTTGGCDLMVATRVSASEPFANPVFLRAINSGSGEFFPYISADSLLLFFSSARPSVGGGTGPYRLWVTARKSILDPFSSPQVLPAHVNEGGSGPYAGTYEPSLSPDGSALYFMSDRPGGFGGFDIWQVSITPVVDFSGSGTVDIRDLLRLIEAWGQDEPALDIAPAPFGDGVIDAADLEAFMNSWGQEVDDPTLKAAWKLDETQGGLAYDSAAINDAVVMGDALWQPNGGHVNGALQFDGVDDYIITPFVLNPADTVLSVFAWIKDAAPGQVIISQMNGANWLLADAQGYSMTQLTSGGRRSDPLYSDAVIADDNWHRVGFTWDGSNRILYVDDVEVAHDTLSGLKGSDGGLYIGAGKGLEAGSFWSGTIDDVRIYSRVVQP